MNSDKDSAKRDRQQLADALQLAGAVNTNKRTIKCPFHEDKHPSAEIKMAGSGFWYFYCYVCDIADDVFALKARIEGRDVSEVLKDEFSREDASRPNRPIAPPPIRRVAPPLEPDDQKESFATFDEALETFKRRNPRVIIQEINKYSDPETDDFDYCVLRYLPREGDKKKFLPLARGGGRWRMEHLAGKRPLFNRKRIAACHSVLIVEGEKCVRYFMKELNFVGVTATTCPQGSNGADRTDLSPLAGKACYVWADNDEPGRKYAETLIDRLLRLDPPCNVVRVRTEDLELPPKGDIVEFVESFPGTADDRTDIVQGVLELGEIKNASAELDAVFKQVRDGTYRNIHFPNMPVLTHMSKALLPGTVTALCGDPGSSKSWLLLEWFQNWTNRSGERVKLMMLEDSMAMHLRRALAQLSGESDINDLDKHAANPDWAEDLRNRYSAEIELLARNLVVLGSSQLTLDEIADWVIDQAESGVEIIGVDPITAAKPEQYQHSADAKFMFKVKKSLEATGSRLILATHPRGGVAGKPGLGGMAGGMAYPRFSQSMFWLKSPEQIVSSNIEMAMYGTRSEKHNRIIEIRKARSGSGSGRHVATHFSGRTLRFEEIGLIAAE
jgi:AAA domain